MLFISSYHIYFGPDISLVKKPTSPGFCSKEAAVSDLLFILKIYIPVFIKAVVEQFFLLLLFLNTAESPSGTFLGPKSYSRVTSTTA